MARWSEIPEATISTHAACAEPISESFPITCSMKSKRTRFSWSFSDTTEDTHIMESTVGLNPPPRKLEGFARGAGDSPEPDRFSRCLTGDRQGALKEPLHVRQRYQADGGLFQEIEHRLGGARFHARVFAAAGAARQLGHELEPLRFTAGEFGGRSDMLSQSLFATKRVMGASFCEPSLRRGGANAELRYTPRSRPIHVVPHHHCPTLRPDAGWPRRFALHPRRGRRPARHDHQLRWRDRLAARAGPRRRAGGCRARLRRARGLSPGPGSLRSAVRALRQSHRARAVHARRHGVPAGGERRRQPSPRRSARFRQAALGGANRARRNVSLRSSFRV